MSFIDEVLEQVKMSESPKSYWYWSSLSAIAAMVGRKVWWDKGYYVIYPNLYVLLVGKSGLRKGLPIFAAMKMVEEAGLDSVITGRASIQAVVSEMSKVMTKEGKEGPKKNSSAYIINDEFSTALVRDPDSYTILTKMYDGHFTSEWMNLLKSTGKEKMKDVCVNLLGGVNEPHFNDLMTSREIEGGFIARTIIDLETRRARKSSLIRERPAPIDYKKLACYLKEVAKLNGPVQPTEEAEDFYDEWYNQFEPEKHDDRTGTSGRIHDTVLKVAILLAISRKPDLVVEKCDVDEALDALAQTTTSIDKITISKGDQEFSRKQQLFVAALLERNPEYKEKKSTLLSSNLGGFDHMDLERIAENLEQAGLLVVELVRVKSRTEIVYGLTPKFLKLLEGKIREKK